MHAGQEYPAPAAALLARLKERPEILLRLLRLLSHPAPEDSLLQEILETLTALLRARYGALALIDEAGQIVRFLYSGLASEEAQRIGRLPQGQGLLGAVLRQNEAVRLADMTQDPRFAGFPPNHPPLKSLLASAIAHEEKLLGCAYLCDKTDGSAFDDKDENLLKYFIEILAPILAHRRAQAANAGATALLENIAQALSAATGEEFFHQLVLALTRTLDMDYAFVGELMNGGDAMRTVAVCAHDKIADNFTYTLAGTPCETVVGKKICTYARDVQKAFPDDHMLAEMGLESYSGSPLFDSSGKPLGILVLVDSKPLVNSEQAEAVLKISASRAAAELERQRAEERIRLLASVAENTADSVLVTDPQGVIQYVNPACEKTTGYTCEEMLGQKPNLVKSGKHDEAFYKQFWDTVLRGEVFRERFINRRKDGSLYYEEKTITPLKNERGKITHFVSTGKDITERVRAEEAAAQAAAEWTYSMDFIEDPLYLLDMDDKILRANRAFYRLTGLGPEQVIGRNISSLMHPHGEAELCPVCRARRERRDAYITLEADDPINPTGKPIEVMVRMVRDDAGEATRVVMGVHDLSRTREAETELRTSRASLAEAQRIAQLGNWEWNVVTDELRCSDEVYRIFFGPMPRPPGATPERLLDSVHPDDRQSVMETVNKALYEKAPYRIDYRIVRPDGAERIVHEEAEVTFDGTGKAVRMIGTIQDVTEQRHAQERLDYLAHYDTLTGLPNRILLRDRLGQVMIEADRAGRIVAIMFLDLDRFKYINDTLGHEVGDALLKSVAERLMACVRPGDTVSRLGGDEFTVVLANVAHVDDVARVAQKVIDGFTPAFVIYGRELFISPSIGITLYPLDDNDAESLLRNADAAMYHAKETGRNTFRFYTAELNRRTAKRLALETALRHALERNEFLLHYQPQVDIRTGRIAGVEALLRWQHPETGLVPPLDFIPLAEETGLIIPIGEWVLRQACVQAKTWHQAGFRHLRVAVNLSGRQFQQMNLVDQVKRILKDTGLAPRGLDLELTESLLMHNTDEVLAAMNELHALGVAFSMDDFGTGYSSLSYLKRFPLDTIKIDRSFVQDIPHDLDDAAITQATIAMAHSLDIKTIAEGVETAKQLAFLRANKCDGMQGYYFSKPVPAEAMTRLLAKGYRLRRRRAASRGQRVFRKKKK